MKRTILRFVLPLLAGLVLVTLVADRLFLSLTRSWFAHDAAARSRLTVASARNSLVSRLHDGDTKGQYGLLANLTRDKRILAVGLCSEDGSQRLASTAYPSEYSCPSLVARWRESMGSDSVWELRSELPSGPVLVSLHPLEDDGHLVGWVSVVQDYHFALAPRMIREMLPQATILTFWHIPWPNAERFGICPWHEEILDGLLGSSIVGFHTQQHCNQFLDAVDAYLEARIDHEENSVVRGGRTSLVRPYPISIAWPDPWAEGQPPVDECRARVLADLGLDPDVRLGIGVDRLDYTKGIEDRLRAVDRLLETFPEYRGKFTFVQIGAPSRSRIPQYQALNEAITHAAEEINARWSAGSWRPVILLKSHHEPKDIYRYYRAADLCYVSSLHDGMNLVAKEYVAARDDEAGCLVLSRFTGAARELTEALIVNPYDLDEAARALAAALRMPASEARERMRSMRRLIASRNIYRWAGRMLLDAAELRRLERLSGRLTSVDDLSQGDA